MSFFGNGGNDDRNLKVAKVEAEILTEMFNKMSQSCFKKCVVKYGESELSVGEMSCIDRCVGKYMQAQDKIGDVLKQMEQQMIAQQQQQQGMMPRK